MNEFIVKVHPHLLIVSIPVRKVMNEGARLYLASHVDGFHPC